MNGCKQRALVVVDMQEDFTRGALGSEAARAIIQNVVDEIQKYLERGDMIILTQDIHDEDYPFTHEGKHLPIPHCFCNTPGVDIIPEIMEIVTSNGVTLLPNVKLFDKNQFGSFDVADELYEWSNTGNGEDCQIKFIGVVLDICVLSNAVVTQTMLPDADIIIDDTCVAATSPEAREATYIVMESLHMDVINRPANEKE